MAWCGLCGESFRLAQVVEDGAALRCPRCGDDLAPGYTPVATAAVRDVLGAAATLVTAGGRLRDVAPHLHVDRRELEAALDRALEG